ncbi:hypothetical protein [uncultured Bacteroides sp.]|uniref:hypothetical protein n=1 Tax=uncultured Bacteroides sp. TaxID=162156 RepID=UPI002AAB95D7|nr:hypothetical protein [uncultured Bacteroides sp.]
MDTDDLTDETYEAIIYEAERFHHDLTLQFGLLSYDCEDEEEYIKASKKLIKQLLKCKNSELEDIFFEDIPTKIELNSVLERIMDNISKLENNTYKCSPNIDENR